MFHIMFSIPCWYVIVRFIYPMPWMLSAKIAVAILLLLASQFHLFSRFSSGSVFSPEFPRAVVMLFNWGFGAILLLAVFQLMTDLGMLVMMLFKHQPLAIPYAFRLGIGAMALLLAGLGVFQASRVPPLKDVEFAINDLPPQFDGYQILHLTDLHISRLFDEQWTRTVVSQSNELGVDLIVITGDLIDGSVPIARKISVLCATYMHRMVFMSRRAITNISSTMKLGCSISFRSVCVHLRIAMPF